MTTSVELALASHNDRNPKSEGAVAGSRHIFATVALIAAGFVVWISLINEPGPPAGDHLDRSWQEAYSYFWKHNFQAGRDYIFISGPLGHFYIPGYDADLFWVDYFFELIFKGWMAFVAVRFAASLPTLLGRLAFCAVVSGPLLVLGYAPDNVLILIVVLSLTMILRNDRVSAYRDILPFSLLISVVALMKFTLMLLAVVAIGILGLHLLIQRNFRLLLVLLLSLVTAFIALWLLCRQSLSNLPTYLFTSMELSSGYVEAMAIEHYWDRLYAVLAIVLLLLFTIIWFPFSRDERSQLVSTRYWLNVALVAVAFILSWKHSFIRADMLHIIGLFWIVLPMLFVVQVAIPTFDLKSTVRVAAISACGALSTFGFLVMAHKHEGVSLTFGITSNFLSHLDYVLKPTNRKRQIDDDRRKLAIKFKLPMIKTTVGNESVDILSYEQGVLFLNDLNWRPRPVFQSYSTYTPSLLAANAEFYRSPQAPNFVILKLQSIDDRLPTADDGLALEEILWRYRPLFEEHSYLLLERRPTPAVRQSATVEEHEIRFDQEIALDEHLGDCQIIELNMELSGRGQVLKTLYQVPKVNIELQMTDGSRRRFRIVPAMAKSGILINPLLIDSHDLTNFFGAGRGNRVATIRLSCNPQKGYQEKIRLVIKSFPKPISL